MTSAQITYFDGWYDQEHDGHRAFRWMGLSSRCRLTVPATSEPAWLRIAAGHASPGVSPSLSVSVNGRPIGSRTVAPHVSFYLFPMGQCAADLDVELTLDRTFRVDGDTRDLGIFVRTMEVIAPERPDADGWYAWERQEYFPFRWMAEHAVLPVPARITRFASLPVYSDVRDGTQSLTIQADQSPLCSLRLLPGWHLYDFDLPAGPAIMLTLEINKLASADSHPADPRQVGARIGELDLHDDARRHEKARTFTEWAYSRVADAGQEATEDGKGSRHRRTGEYFPEDSEGWYCWEYQEQVPFRWMKIEGLIRVPSDAVGCHQFCTIPVFSEVEDASQVLSIEAGGKPLVEVHLSRYWNYCTFQVPSPDDLALTLRVNSLIPASSHPGDNRELGVRVGPLRFHDSAVHQAGSRLSGENAELNQREMEAGATVLQSYPLNLGIDLYGKCNIKPPCVYCLWDPMKDVEGDNVNVVVDDSTFEGYGPFFNAARSLTNCSFGEPLLHPRFKDVIEFFDRHDKLLDLSTNGQAFTPATVEALAGRRITLYVSLDSASPAIYARLRNDRWHDVITGLTFLADARRRAKGLPKLNMVFMPMRANLDDLEPYFKLCQMVGADALVLRPLLRLEQSGIVADRGGYHFDYDRELLDRTELDAVFARCQQYSVKYHVSVASQFDFGKYS